MEEKAIQIVTSEQFRNTDLQAIHEYGSETFGMVTADFFIQEIYEQIDHTKTKPLLFPECRHLPTKSKKYRNIVLGSYLIIYRITTERIEILRALHGSQSPKIFKQARSIKIK